MNKVVLRALDYTTLLDKLELLGLEIRRDEPVEYHIGRCSTPVLNAIQGRVITILLRDSESTILPDITGPDFLVDWTDEDTVEVEVEQVDEEGNITTMTVTEPLPWPMYDVTSYDENGVVTGTAQQGAPRIS